MAELFLAEFAEPAALARALTTLRERGVEPVDAYTPYSTDAVREALGADRSPLSALVLVAGVAGAALAYGLEWLLVAHLYPLNVGGRSPHLPLSFVPIAFEMGVLAASVTGFVAALGCGRLVRLYDPVFEEPGFESVTQSGFWLRLEPGVARSRSNLEAELVELGARRVTWLTVPA